MPFLETASPVSLGNQSYHFPVTDTRLTYTTHTPSALESERERETEDEPCPQGSVFPCVCSLKETFSLHTYSNSAAFVSTY